MVACQKCKVVLSHKQTPTCLHSYLTSTHLWLEHRAHCIRQRRCQSILLVLLSIDVSSSIMFPIMGNAEIWKAQSTSGKSITCIVNKARQYSVYLDLPWSDLIYKYDWFTYLSALGYALVVLGPAIYKVALPFSLLSSSSRRSAGSRSFSHS